MIEQLSAVATGTCRNCGGPIVLMSGDLTGLTWYHGHRAVLSEPGPRECPGTTYAEPEEP